MPEMTPLETAERIKSAAYNLRGFAKCLRKTGRAENNVLADDVDLAVSYLRKIASGEYAPVVHGRWEQKGTQWPICTNCGKPTLSKGYCPAYSDICPSCGAIMDESRNRNNDHGKEPAHE